MWSLEAHEKLQVDIPSAAVPPYMGWGHTPQRVLREVGANLLLSECGSIFGSGELGPWNNGQGTGVKQGSRPYLLGCLGVLSSLQALF